jgi:hypothetical protein
MFLKTSVLALGLLLSALPKEAVAQVSPVGDWDFVISGGKRGVAFITFSNDFSLSGYQITAPLAAKSSSVSINPRTGRPDQSGVNPRTGVGPTATNTVTEVTNSFGGALIWGNWALEAPGRIIGVYNELTSTIGQNGGLATNGVGFRGVVRTGRMTLSRASDAGKLTLTGVPFTGVPDISASYYGVGTKGKGLFAQFFTLSPALDFPNRFVVSKGVAPGFGFEGSALLSVQNQLAVLFLQTDTNGVTSSLTALVGPINPGKGTATLRGSDGSPFQIVLKVGRQP